MALCPLIAGCRAGDAQEAVPADHEARWFERMDGDKVHCLLCPRECIVADGARGACDVRENRGGEYRTLVYGHVCSAHVDPIELEEPRVRAAED